MAGLKNENEERFNIPLITGEIDTPLVECVMDSLRTLEVIDNIKIIDWSYTHDPAEVNDQTYISTRKKANRKRGAAKEQEERKRYVPLTDSNNGQLTVKFLLKASDGEQELVKNFLIPYADGDGYMYSKGTRFYMMYQLVDASTYIRKNSVIAKALMPIQLTREISKHPDKDGFEMIGKTYTMSISAKKEIDVLIFYFAKWGMSKTFKFLNVDNVIWLAPSPDHTDKYTYFKINKRIYLAVDKKAMKFNYVMSIAFMVLNLVSNRLNIEDVDKTEFWLEKLGAARGGKNFNLVEKGMSSLNHLERNFNAQTKSILKLDEKNKKTAFHLVRWMIQNYGALRSKDELSLDNKRIRRNEYIASLLTNEINTRLNRIIYMGNNIKLENLFELFNFNSGILIRTLHGSGLFRFDERVNDLDFISKLQYTTKGPNSLGGKNQKSMSLKFRSSHPSYLGNIDLSVVSSSDPGSSGMLTPFAKTEGMFFSDKPEPQDGVDDFLEYVNESYGDVEGETVRFPESHTEEVKEE